MNDSLETINPTAACGRRAQRSQPQRTTHAKTRPAGNRDCGINHHSHEPVNRSSYSAEKLHDSGNWSSRNGQFRLPGFRPDSELLHQLNPSLLSAEVKRSGDKQLRESWRKRWNQDAPCGSLTAHLSSLRLTHPMTASVSPNATRFIASASA